MPTNLAIDDALLEQARDVSGLRTKKAVVTQALMEFIQKRQQSRVLALFGAVQYEAGYDYKAQRQVRLSHKDASAG